MTKPKDIIQFSHANGFPGSTYRSLFNLLEHEYEIRYVDVIGHNPAFPVTDNWPYLVDELIENIEQNYREPVIGVGHSLGGVLTFLAAIQRPDIFKALVLLDTPIFSYFRARILQFFKYLGFFRWMKRIRTTEKRRSTWTTEHEAIQYFRKRTLFKNFTYTCLRDYVRYGTMHSEQGIKLKFNPEIESKIYKTLPHHYSQFNYLLKTPCYAIFGKETDILNPMDIHYMRKYYNIHSIEVEGSHLFPFEFPEKTAEKISDVIHEMLKRRQLVVEEQADGKDMA